MLSNEDSDDEKVEREDGDVESEDDDDEPTVVSRSKHFAKQVTLFLIILLHTLK